MVPSAVVAWDYRAIVHETGRTMQLRTRARCQHRATFGSCKSLLLWLSEYMTGGVGPHASARVGGVLDGVSMLHVEVVCLAIGHVLCSVALLTHIVLCLHLGYVLVIWTDTIVFFICVH